MTKSAWSQRRFSKSVRATPSWAVLRTSGHMRHTGLPAKVQWAAVVTMRGGKLAHAQGYLTKAEALEAVGLRE